MKQYLCSHLVVLQSAGGDTTANLEKIWADGASVNAEESIAEGSAVAILADGYRLPGVISSCESDSGGNFMEIALDDEWSKEKFLPDHLTDPDLFAVRASAADPKSSC